MNQPNYNYYLLDVFTDKFFGGNQLAVFTDAAAIPEENLQKIARELNLSETVFIYPSDLADLRMRIFTPASELPTAGHPTVGTAHLVAYLSDKQPTAFQFEQKVGIIDVAIAYENGALSEITISQPLPKFGPIYQERAAMAEILGLSLDEVLEDLPIQEISCGNSFLIVPVRKKSSLANIQFDSSRWARFQKQTTAMGLYVFTLEEVEGGDVQGRMFDPTSGIFEDPATGSANGPLACYLAKYTKLTFPLRSLQGYEMGRPSELNLFVLQGDENEIKKVTIGGKSKIIGRGKLFLS